MILKSMKKWDKCSKIDEIDRKKKVFLKMEKIKSDELFDKVFLKNNANDFFEEN